MHSESNFLVRLLAAACVTLAGCGGAALLKEARPVVSSGSLAEAKDERIQASIETLILRNGPGAWARDAEWDEYVVRIRALSDEPVEIREIALYDALDHRVAARADRGDLVDGTRETARRYQESGRVLRTDGTDGWVVAGAGTAGVASVVGMTAGPGFAGVATAAAAAGVVAGVGLVFVGAGIVRLVNNAEVNTEIKRRRSTLPIALPRGAEASVDLFFPITPLSGRTEVVYADRRGEHRLDIDTRQARMILERVPPPTLVSRTDPSFPERARQMGIDRGYVRARLTLNKQGQVRDVEVIEASSRFVFEEEARMALRWWTYSESRDDGRTVEVTLEFRR